MRIIISPAKQMIIDNDTFGPEGASPFETKTREILSYLQNLSYQDAKKLWACSDKLATENYDRLQEMDLERNLSPAILSYNGIAFKYMAPSVFETGQFDYVQEHLRILSAFYGVLKAMDGVIPYRLEMQAKARVAGTKNLYEFWGRSLYEEVQKENDDRIIINLASAEYSRCIEEYLQPRDRFINCIFAEKENGKLVQKGVFVKMARGEMVRFMAEIDAQNPEDLKDFHRLGYHYSAEESDVNKYVFLKA